MPRNTQVGKAVLRSAYKKIPKFDCIEGCTDCCGIVVWTEMELERVKERKFHTDTDCPYIGPKGCTVYGQRPLVCRMFGAVDAPLLECSHGRGPKKKLSEEEGEKIMEAYKQFSIAPIL